MREDETAAACFRHPHHFLSKVAAFTIRRHAGPGLPGGMYAHLNYLITPRDFGFFIAVDLLIYNIVGGHADVVWSILGAALIHGIARKILRGVGVTAGPIPYGRSTALILLLVILFLPNGLASPCSPAFGRRAARAGSHEGLRVCLTYAEASARRRRP